MAQRDRINATRTMLNDEVQIDRAAKYGTICSLT